MKQLFSSVLKRNNNNNNFEEYQDIPSIPSYVKPKTAKPVLRHLQTPKGVFLIPPYYEYVRLLGSGAYGIVIEAKDTRTGEHLAIKKMTDTFNQVKEFQKRIYREIKIMKHFCKYPHPNVIRMVDLIAPKSYKEFHDIYIIQELMITDFRQLIRSGREFSDTDIQYFIYYILKGLGYIHSAGILHRDIKPSNILLGEEPVKPKPASTSKHQQQQEEQEDAGLAIKICDFGLSKGADFEDPNNSTTYVVTRPYRAPELILQYNQASTAMDIWAVGAIMAELLSPVTKRKQMPFLPGQSSQNQLDLIVCLLGNPKPSYNKGSEKWLNYLHSFPKIAKKDLRKELAPGTSALAIDLVSKMLAFDPEDRVTVPEALKHPYLAQIRQEDENPNQLSCPSVFETLENQVGEEAITKQEKQQIQSSSSNAMTDSPSPTLETSSPELSPSKKMTYKRLIYNEIMEWNRSHNIDGDAEIIG